MELEILKKLKDRAEELDEQLSDPNARWKSKREFAKYVEGFCDAVDMIEEIVNNGIEKMAADYAESEAGAEMGEG
jgi:hypothetical protein